ncbi:DUF4825 domain-containing protein [Actinomycetes bacterium NPDC127524]
MRRIAIGISFLIIWIFIGGCSSGDKENDDIFRYKGSYAGDNSAIVNIIRELPNGKHVKKIELKTKENPYGMIIKYGDMEAISKGDAIKETVIYNAAFIFALVKNADWVSFDIKGQAYKVTRNELRNWYGKKLSSFTKERDLKKITKEYLEDEKKMNGFILNAFS